MKEALGILPKLNVVVPVFFILFFCCLRWCYCVLSCLMYLLKICMQKFACPPTPSPSFYNLYVCTCAFTCFLLVCNKNLHLYTNSINHSRWYLTLLLLIWLALTHSLSLLQHSTHGMTNKFFFVHNFYAELFIHDEKIVLFSYSPQS